MGPPSYKRSVVDRNVDTWRIPCILDRALRPLVATRAIGTGYVTGQDKCTLLEPGAVMVVCTECACVCVCVCVCKRHVTPA